MKKITYYLFSLLMAAILSYSFVSSINNDKEIHVTVKYKSQPGKTPQALAELKNLVKSVSKEPHYKNITMLIDQADSTSILLHETWDDEAYYKGDHMKTDHLQKFITDSRTFLAGPPEITFWKVVK